MTKNAIKIVLLAIIYLLACQLNRIDGSQLTPESEHKNVFTLDTQYHPTKRGELALLLASRYPQITGVIARVPSSVVFQGIGQTAFKPNKSSWSYQGKPLLFVPYIPFDDSNQKARIDMEKPIMAFLEQLSENEPPRE